MGMGMTGSKIGKGLAVAAMAGFLLSGCQPGRDEIRPKPAQDGAHLQLNEYGSAPMLIDRRQVWVPLRYVASSLGYRIVQQGNRVMVGDTDPVLAFLADGKHTDVEGRSIRLPDQPKLVKGEWYVTTPTLSALLFGGPGQPGLRAESWGGLFGYSPGSGSSGNPYVRTPRYGYGGSWWGGGPGGGTNGANGGSAGQTGNAGTAAKGGGTAAGTGESAVTGEDLVSYAKKFVGTPYEFGAAKYPDSGTFDCSSFMQYVYGHFGIDLPRSSKQQSQVGRDVDIGSLQPGDLLFFYTPGRYASNKIVGHVGMYIGQDRLIQTYGDPGVVVSDFNDYWRGRFLAAKRVL